MELEQISQAVEEMGQKSAKAIDDTRNEVKELSETVADLHKSFITMGQQMASGYSGGMPGNSASPLTKALQDERIKSFISDRGIPSASVRLQTSIPMLVKTTITGDAQSDTSQYDVQRERAGGLFNNPMRRLTVLETLPRIPTSSNTFEWQKLSGYVNNAAEQANEGDTKAETAVPTTLDSVGIKTFAHWVPVSEQVLADAPALQDQVSILLRYGVLSKANAYIVDTLESEGTAQVYDVDYFLPDAISTALTTLETAGWSGNLIIMNPNDWDDIRTTRELGTSGMYLFGNPGTAAAMQLWNVPVITDPSVAVGSPIVMDTSQVWVLDRQDAMVTMGRIGNQFVQNLVTIRGELRMALAVLSPTAVRVLTPSS
jgi:HK97 family phage major capsid protein